ncbi:non-functional pseudokinase ZED1-like [Tripterygium wilfordii]|uniref:non-functional pseudokinase ZED1-like n=1 Tax=Tripterygium wilfordii TaxID=458696 RepID=UPI0018F812AE|nr:non-functional pseudokinase ZED1-like [Tripterygium wilfordii]
MSNKWKEDQERFFLKNGALVLEQIITGFNGKCNPIRSFTEQELNEATNSYERGRILRDDLYHTLYKGIHEDREISVKKFKRTSTVEWITNEIAIASNMSNHKHVLKLIGYCLETQLPLLVYEFAGNGILSKYIYNAANQPQELPWETKLRIATEISNAVAYVHYGTSKLILHRNINPTNIILGEDYVAKLLDFQLAIPIPAGEQHVYAEEICGIMGYVAPEILSGRYTEKCDVYSFGVVLLEMLTRERVGDLGDFYELGTIIAPGDVNGSLDAAIGRVSFDKDHQSSYDFIVRKDGHDESGSNRESTYGLIAREDSDDESGSNHENGRSNYWNTYFQCCLQAVLLEEGDRQLVEFGELTLKCLKHNPDERPTMKEVSQELRSISRRHSYAVPVDQTHQPKSQAIRSAWEGWESPWKFALSSVEVSGFAIPV